MKRALTIITMLFLAAGLTLGCSDKEEQPKPVAKKPAATKPTEAPKKPEAKLTEGEEKKAEEEIAEEEEVEVGYSYKMYRADGKIKRNPFQPIDPGVTTPLKDYELSQMGVNGVLIHGVRKASVMTPDCRSTTVKVGDPIGIHDGHVVDISLQGLLVKETYMDIKGRIQEYERLILNEPYSCSGRR